MRLVVCLVFLASFALVCQGEAQRGGFTGPIPRPPPHGRPPLGPICNACYRLSFSDVRICCNFLGKCCHLVKG
uniref:Antimicrobial peptide PEN2-2 n=1 Tax=Penaeus schmitti TaxID=122378 RepID=Q56H81_PENSC|nr:antimicrobial peptide PEN2-2 [Penaeus schmitti]